MCIHKAKNGVAHMKRVNIYIKEEEDKAIDHLSEIMDSNRSEIIRMAVQEFADRRQEDIDNFLEGLDFEEDKEDEKERINNSQLMFYKQCIDDPIFFAENAISYQTKDAGYTNLKLYDFQKEILSELNHRKRTIMNKSRQMGGTMLGLVNIVHYVISNTDKTIVIMANKLNQSQELLKRVRDMIESLPEFMRPELSEKNKRQIRLDNGCRILATSCMVDSLRSYTVNYLFMDEVAFIKREYFDDFLAATMPVLMASKNSQIHIMSTPNGPNHFMKMFSDAICNYINFYAMEIPWDVGVPGRDEEWKESMITQIGPIRFQQEFECKFIYRRGIGNGI